MATSPCCSQSELQLNAFETTTFRNSKSEPVLQLPQPTDKPLQNVAAPAYALDHLLHVHDHLIESPRTASSSSLVSGESSRATAQFRNHNPLRCDHNRTIISSSENVAITKHNLSPRTSPLPPLAEIDTSSSSTLLDKFLNRHGTSMPETLKRNPPTIIEDERLQALNVVVMNSNLPPPPFANMYACESCREDIGSLLSKGRHHCRNCGGSFCAECSTKVICVPYQAYVTRGALRVCDGCYHRIQNFHKQVKSTNVTWSGLQPPAISDLVKTLELSDNEEPVSIFNCALFLETTPYYGHLVLTRRRLCFLSYVDAIKRKVAYAQILSLLKPQFYYISGLQVKTKHKETFFLAEFNGLRDTCFLRLDQLIRAYQEASKITSIGPGKSPSSTQLRKEALDRRRSYKLITEHLGSSTSGCGAILHPSLSSSPLSTVGFIDFEQDDDKDLALREIIEGDSNTDDNKSTASDEEPFEPLPLDPFLSKMTVLLDCDMRADVKRVFDLLWTDGPGREFLHASLEKARDIDIDIESWQVMNHDDTALMSAIQNGFEISKEKDYTLYRIVRSQHPPKTSFPGLPPYAGCTRTQRFRLDASSNGGDKWDRFVITEVNRMSKIPFCDYFEVEMRYVFSRDGNNYCHVQVGLVVNFLKPTWFKTQINSSTRSESKEAVEAWAKQAIEFLETQQNRIIPLTPTVKALVGTDCLFVSESDESRNLSKNSNLDRRASANCFEPNLKSVRLKSANLVQWPRAYGQLVFLGLLLYCLMLLRGYHFQMQQFTDATTKVLDHLQEQQAMMQRQFVEFQQSCHLSETKECVGHFK